VCCSRSGVSEGLVLHSLQLVSKLVEDVCILVLLGDGAGVGHETGLCVFELPVNQSCENEVFLVAF